MTLLGLCVLFVMAAGITIAAYLSFIIPEYRGESFYAAMVSSCIAEMVFFGYLGYTIGARSSPNQPDSAVRMRLMMLITLWTLAILITSGISVDFDYADTFFSDHIVLLQLIFTFLAFAAVFFQHRQATAVQMRDAAPQRERRQLESYAGGLDALLDEVRALAGRKPDHTVALDTLVRRIDTLKTQLLSVSAAMSRETGRPAEPADRALIEQRLNQLHDEAARLASAGDDDFVEQMQKTRSAADRALTALRQREDTLTF